MMKKNILVDLLPVLPGGLNGGAKVMVMDLLKTMCELTPNFSWTFLIQPGMEEELNALAMPHVNFLPIKASPFTLIYRSLAVLIEQLRQKFALPNFIYKRLLSQLNVLRSKMTKKIKGVNHDLLFCPFTDPVFYQKNIPTIAIVHDLQYLTYPTFFDYADLLHRGHVIKNACSKASQLISVSEYSKNRLLETQNISQEKIKTIPTSLSQRLEYDSNFEGILKKHCLKPQKYFIYPANFWKHKNHEMLILAFNRALKSLDDDMKLVLTGTPCDRQDFLKIAVKSQHLEKSILFLDYVHNEELAILIKNSVALIFPSLYEGFGMPVVEAMALGAPVLCSNTTSLPEVAGDAALFFAPQDLESIINAMIKISTDESLRDLLIEQGHQQAKKYADVKKMALDYLDVFHFFLLSKEI